MRCDALPGLLIGRSNPKPLLMKIWIGFRAVSGKVDCCVVSSHGVQLSLLEGPHCWWLAWRSSCANSRSARQPLRRPLRWSEVMARPPTLRHQCSVLDGGHFGLSVTAFTVSDPLTYSLDCTESFLCSACRLALGPVTVDGGSESFDW